MILEPTFFNRESITVVQVNDQYKAVIEDSGCIYVVPDVKYYGNTCYIFMDIELEPVSVHYLCTFMARNVVNRIYQHSNTKDFREFEVVGYQLIGLEKFNFPEFKELRTIKKVAA